MGECCWYKTPVPPKLKQQQQQNDQRKSTHFGPVPVTAEQFPGTAAGLSPSLTSVSHTGATSGETEWPAHTHTLPVKAQVQCCFMSTETIRTMLC